MDRSFTDSSAGPAGQPVAYTLTLEGTGEAALSTGTKAPGVVTAAATPPELQLRFEGTLADASGRGNHATAEGAALFTTGKAGQALILKPPCHCLHGCRADSAASGWNSPRADEIHHPAVEPVPKSLFISAIDGNRHPIHLLLPGRLVQQTGWLPLYQNDRNPAL